MPIPQSDPGVGRQLLRDGVHGRLRDAIIDGTFEPGEQLRDAELAAWLGVSRTPVREALLRLAQSGLVVARPGRSTTVSAISATAVREARDVVAAMHELAVREAVPRLSPENLAMMREAGERFEAAVAAGDVEAALRADDELHDVPVRVSGNRALATVLDQFVPVLRRAERLQFASASARESITRHRDLIRLCGEGDAEGAAAVVLDTFHALSTAGAGDTTDTTGAVDGSRG